MAYGKKSSEKEESVLVGKVGEFEVKKVGNSPPCIVVGNRWYSPKRAAELVESLPQLQEFLKKYGADVKPTAPKEVLQENAKMKAELAALNAKLAMLGNGRFSPESANLAAAA